MKKAVFISLVAVAVLGLMSENAKGDWGWIDVSIVNATEGPVDITLDPGNCGAQFSQGGYTCTLQPSQSITASGIANQAIQQPWFGINYYFSSSEDPINWIPASIYQRVSIDINTAIQTKYDCADACDGTGNYSVSAGIFVDATFLNVSVGDELAQFMGLHGTAEKIVGGLINYFMEKEDYDPGINKEEQYQYSVTIGQQNYNLENLMSVNWGYQEGSHPPPIAFVTGQQVCYFTDSSWSVSENMSNKATVASFDIMGNACVGMNSGPVVDYQNSGCLISYLPFNSTKSVSQISRAPGASAPTRYVAAYNDSSVIYFDGTTGHTLQGTGWDSAIMQMCVNWTNRTPPLFPQVVVGLVDGAVIYYNGTSWANLQTANHWGTSVMQLLANWNVTNALQVVVGLGNGTVEWYSSYSQDWDDLYEPGYAFTNPVYQLSASFNEPYFSPSLVASLFDGSIYYQNWNQSGHYWELLAPQGAPHVMDVHWVVTNEITNAKYVVPVIMAGSFGNNGYIAQYQNGTWHVAASNVGTGVSFISADWSQFDDTRYDTYQRIPYVYYVDSSCYYANGPRIVYDYPAIPSTTSLCGDLDGDGKDDLISVEGSQWYIWYSEGEHSERSGPYDLGIQGTPLVGDVDGDGQDDFIMVDGASWHAWLSSMRHNWHSQRIGPSDLGIYGTPLLGDIDGDGQKDLIMVMGSLWYIWPSSLGYTQRCGPYDTGIRGLPATGDLNGDGLADMITVKGSDWYICYSIVPGQYGPWCGPYDVGISGAPATGDLNGDGLADLIIVVGSNWYVCFATSPGQYGTWYGPFAKSVL